jgi:hypothetical protein
MESTGRDGQTHTNEVGSKTNKQTYKKIPGSGTIEFQS